MRSLHVSEEEGNLDMPFMYTQFGAVLMVDIVGFSQVRMATLKDGDGMQKQDRCKRWMDACTARNRVQQKARQRHTNSKAKKKPPTDETDVSVRRERRERAGEGKRRALLLLLLWPLLLLRIRLPAFLVVCVCCSFACLLTRSEISPILSSSPSHPHDFLPFDPTWRPLPFRLLWSRL